MLLVQNGNVYLGGGRYESGWEYDGDTVKYTVTVPFGCEAEVVLPGKDAVTVTAGSYTF